MVKKINRKNAEEENRSIMTNYTIKKIQTAALTSEHYGLLLEADPAIEYIENYLSNGLIFELKKQEQLVGVLVLQPQIDKKNLEIKNISVKESFQRQGLGTYLLTEAILYAKSLDYDNLYIGTGTTSFHQLALYQKMGFRFESIKKDCFSHYPEPIYENGLRLYDMILLKKTLA